MKNTSITVETVRDYLPGESNKLEHAIRRTSRKTSRGLYILRVCKLNGFSAGELDILFNSSIVSLFMFGAEVWGCAAHSKYLLLYNKNQTFYKTINLQIYEYIKL